MVLVPRWDGNGDDGVLKALTDALLDVMGSLAPGDDVRQFTNAVQEAAAKPLSEAAAAAATAASTAVTGEADSGGIAVAKPGDIEVHFDDDDDTEEEEDQEHAGVEDAQESVQHRQLVAA